MEQTTKKKSSPAPRYLTTRQIEKALSKIDEIEQRQIVLEEKMTRLSDKLDEYLEFQKNRRKQILNDLKVE